MNGKVICLVSSFIEPYEGGPRSKFSVEERVQQTKETLSSIRLKCPEAKIVLVEGSDTEIEKWNLDYDDVVLCRDNPEIRNIIYNNFKSLGECAMMMHVGKKLDLENYEIVMKISGRYKLTDDFSLERISKERFTFYDAMEWGYETMLYFFPGKLKGIWLDTLHKAFKYMKETGTDSIERGIRYHLHVKYVHGVDLIGVEGNNAPEGNFIKY
jgi:hypothetical protein